MQVEYVPIDSIKPYEKNAKKHPDEQVEHIANSIKEFGFRQPLVIDKDNVVVIGHGRLLAAKKLGIAEVPVLRADDLTEAQINALRLADNKTNESEWDFDLLGGELDDIFDIDMSDFGFDEFQQETEADIREIELKPYRKVHYLVTLDVNDNDKIAEIIAKLCEMDGVEVESTLN
jgi:site-specific DNA-methyltransferase (adenine-specific)